MHRGASWRAMLLSVLLWTLFAKAQSACDAGYGGSYANTCVDCSCTGETLQCLCSHSRGEQTTALDLTTCLWTYDIDNREGVLTCGRVRTEHDTTPETFDYSNPPCNDDVWSNRQLCGSSSFIEDPCMYVGSTGTANVVAGYNGHTLFAPDYLQMLGEATYTQGAGVVSWSVRVLELHDLSTVTRELVIGVASYTALDNVWTGYGYAAGVGRANGAKAPGFSFYGEPYGVGDVITVRFDVDNLVLSFAKNGVYQNISHTYADFRESLRGPFARWSLSVAITSNPDGEPPSRRAAVEIVQCDPILPDKVEYVGCYLDVAEDRATTGAHLQDPEMTVEMCAAFCHLPSSGPTNVFGLQGIEHCFCDNSTGMDAVFRHGEALYWSLGYEPCDQPCGGDRRQICGGPLRNSVFRTPPPPSPSQTAAPTPAPTEFPSLFNRSVCEPGGVLAGCSSHPTDDGLVIEVVAATFGRSDDTTCTDVPVAAPAGFACARDATDYVARLCDDSRECALSADNGDLVAALGGDPCAGVVKYLDVAYRCVDPPPTPMPTGVPVPISTDAPTPMPTAMRFELEFSRPECFSLERGATYSDGNVTLAQDFRLEFTLRNDEPASDGVFYELFRIARNPYDEVYGEFVGPDARNVAILIHNSAYHVVVGNPGDNNQNCDSDEYTEDVQDLVLTVVDGQADLHVNGVLGCSMTLLQSNREIEAPIVTTDRDYDAAAGEVCDLRLLNYASTPSAGAAPSDASAPTPATTQAATEIPSPQSEVMSSASGISVCNASPLIAASVVVALLR